MLGGFFDGFFQRIFGVEVTRYRAKLLDLEKEMEIQERNKNEDEMGDTRVQSSVVAPPAIKNRCRDGRQNPF